MKTILFRFLISATLLISFSACSDFLDEESKTKYTSQYIYGTEDGLSMAVTSLYALDRQYQDQNEASVTFALTRATDESVTNGGTGNFYGTYDPNYLKPSAAQPKDMWQGMYNIIGKCNDIIKSAEQFPESESLTSLIGQAKAFRAQSYFLLYRTFDRIWLNTISTTPENVNDKRDYRPATKEEVFKLLYEDMNYAIQYLEWAPKDKGRYNKAAACHLLAKIALWNEDWDTVLKQIDAIENSGIDYQLVDVDKIFNSENLNHSEALLVQQWSRNPGGNLSQTTPKGNLFASFFIAPYRTVIGGNDEFACSFENWGYTYGRCYPSPYLFSLYDQIKDKRFNTFYIHKYKNTTNKIISTGGLTVQPGEYFPLRDSKGNVNKNLYPGCVKYGDIWTRTPYEIQSYKDVIIYRLAETYIMAAEAALRKGDQDLAKKYYNKTWMRAGNEAFTGTLTMQNIIDEQARELALEGDRWYFLKRHGLLIEQVKKYAGDVRISASIKGRTNLPNNPHFVRWPIPENEVINMGPENFPQNPGYN
ncbi:MAG: RagB/SusD family nutrient uptake outer membrane protein [Bacteroidales bacterium]